MKLTPLFFFIVLACIANAQVPEFWGAARFGGTHDAGTIYQLNQGKIEKLYDFEHKFRGKGISWLHYDALSDEIIGTTYWGGDYESPTGTIFSYNPSTNALVELWVFNKPKNGLYPSSRTVYHDGILYGVTAMGGNYNRGVIYQFNPSTKEFAVLHHMGLSDGNISHGGSGLILMGNKLYGNCISNGRKTYGSLFEYDIKNKGFSVVYVFEEGDEGKHCVGDLLAANNTIYGISKSGGDHDLGTLYSFDVQTKKLKVLHHFTKNEGGASYSHSLLLLGDSLIMGTTGGEFQQQRMTIYGYNLKQHAFKVQHRINNHNHTTPYYSNIFMLGTSPNMYFTISNSHKDSLDIFKLNLKTKVVQKIFHADDKVVGTPNHTGLINTPYGYFGTAITNGPTGTGGIVKLNFNPVKGGQIGYKLVLPSYKAEFGANPSGKLLPISDKAFLVPVSGGCEHGSGGIVRYNVQTQKVDVMNSFNGTVTGNAPARGLVQANGKYVYGVNTKGGKYDNGTILN